MICSLREHVAAISSRFVVVARGQGHRPVQVPRFSALDLYDLMSKIGFATLAVEHPYEIDFGADLFSRSRYGDVRREQAQVDASFLSSMHRGKRSGGLLGPISKKKGGRSIDVSRLPQHQAGTIKALTFRRDAREFCECRSTLAIEERAVQGRRLQERTGQYAVDDFASKHGLSEKSATVILNLYGPSWPACDAAAVAFKEAITQRQAGRLTNLLNID